LRRFEGSAGTADIRQKPQVAILIALISCVDGEPGGGEIAVISGRQNEEVS